MSNSRSKELRQKKEIKENLLVEMASLTICRYVDPRGFAKAVLEKRRKSQTVNICFLSSKSFGS
jgi:hypothetical protein